MVKALIILGLLASVGMSGQTISGKVTNQRNEPLVGASVYWAGTTQGTSTGPGGNFKLSATGITNKKLVASFVGFVPDTLEITQQTFVEFRLKESTTLGEVVVSGQREGVIISDAKEIKTEQITQTELQKSACCDLAGCFETQTTVQPQVTNVVTNSKELRILGLSGVYNQILIDGFPMIQGLTYTYGISGIPGTLVENIYVAKGANSVLQGFESISGQINVETKDPAKTDRLLLNFYINNFAEKHTNANFSFKVGKWNSLASVHTVQPANKIDRDNDGFLDLPLLTRYMVFNNWKYGNEANWGWHSKVGVRLLNEERIGGQSSFNPQTDRGSTSVYGQTVNINQPELWTKTGYRFNDNHAITFIASAFLQEQNAYFGSVKYDARQTNAYANVQYEWAYGNHEVKTGISYRHLNLREDIAFTDDFLQRSYDGIHHRVEHIPGVFAENTLRFSEKLTWITGLRADHHNQFGMRLTPRTLVKYDIAPNSILRANVGLGWRTVNLFSENIGLLVSSRDVVFAEELRPEQAVNFGVNYIQKFDYMEGNLSGFLSLDFYHTDFQNQIFPDYDSDPRLAIVENFTGRSVSNGFQAEVFLKIYERFEFKTGFNYLDVYRKVEGEKQLLPFNPKHRVITTFSYRPLSNRFHFDTNIHWYGRQRLPNTQSNPEAFQRPDFSETYTVANAQFTYKFKKVDVYFGCENIFDFRQLRPILSWQDPFSPYFDTSSVWGPTRGREFYLGLRFRLERKG